MTSKRGDPHNRVAAREAPSPASPSGRQPLPPAGNSQSGAIAPGAGLGPLDPSAGLRESWRTMLGFGLGCFALGVIVGVIGFAAVLVFVFGVTR